MENTTENKAKFVALYWGQIVAKITKGSYTHRTGTIHVVDKNVISSIESEGYVKHKYSLELAPLSSITDGDAIELAKIGLPERVYDYLWSSQTGKAIARSIQAGRQTNNFYPFFKMGDAFDFLRSKGYAVDWLCLSVDEQIKYGWVKLKDKE